MRIRLALFIIISFLVHLFIISLLDVIPPEKKKEKISVRMIEKKKPKPEPPEPKPEIREEAPEETFENIPLDEELETKIDQMAPVPDEGLQREESEKQAEEPIPEEQEKKPKKEEESDIAELDEVQAPVEVPKITRKEEPDREKLEGILNPNDIIEKYAREGGEVDGEDTVSMQYVKLKYQSYFYKFARRLYQVWLYPRAAAYRGEHGTVRIKFSIARDGMISGIKVVKSSGYPDLDREAVQALKKTAGVPLPPSYELNFLRVDAYFQYVLGGGFNVY